MKTKDLEMNNAGSEMLEMKIKSLETRQASLKQKLVSREMEYSKTVEKTEERKPS